MGNKPPPDLDPEKFIFGTGSYSVLVTHRAESDDATFAIVPRPLPVKTIVVANLIVLAIVWGIVHLAESQPAPAKFLGLPEGAWIVLGIVFLFTAGVVFAFWQARRRGPWLIYQKATGRVLLPRVQETFELDEIVQLQYVSTQRLSATHDNDRRSELNLITLRDGVRRRCPLLRHIHPVRAFDALLVLMQQQTRLPIVRVEQDANWNIVERPFDDRDLKPFMQKYREGR